MYRCTVQYTSAVQYKQMVKTERKFERNQRGQRCVLNHLTNNMYKLLCFKKRPNTTELDIHIYQR